MDSSSGINVYTTVSDGRTHIAYGEKYVGSINSYNNFFTKFFTWLFQVSTTVNFDGKDRSVNKKSYAKLLGKLNVIPDNSKNLSVFKTIVQWDKVELKGEDYMRGHLSDSKRHTLFKKLAIAISTDQTARALKMIHKGASLDQDYYDRETFGPSFHSETEGLKRENNYVFSFFKGPPILQAAYKSTTNKLFDEVVTELKNYGAYLKSQGHSGYFSQESHRSSVTNSLFFKLNNKLKLVSLETQDSESPDEEIPS